MSSFRDLEEHTKLELQKELGDLVAVTKVTLGPAEGDYEGDWYLRIDHPPMHSDMILQFPPEELLKEGLIKSMAACIRAALKPKLELVE